MVAITFVLAVTMAYAANVTIFADSSLTDSLPEIVDIGSPFICKPLGLEARGEMDRMPMFLGKFPLYPVLYPA